jgi:threonyl-tRNA synthetase
LRVEVDDSSEKVGKKIRNGSLMKIPYMLVVGDREAESGELNVRHRTGVETPDVPVERFIEVLAEEASTRALEPAGFGS